MKSSGYIHIASINIDSIGGPVSFSILEPSTFFSKYIHFSPLLLIGDHHNCNKNICDTDINKTTIFTNTPLWFRLLDCYGTENYPIQYFVESYFEKDLFTDPYYEEEQNIKWLTNTNSKTFMNYMIKYNPKCFSDSQHADCITKFITYNFSDLRSTTVLKINSFEVKKYKKPKTYKKGQSHNTIRNFMHKFKKDELKNNSLPFYESQLFDFCSDYSNLSPYELQQNKELNLFKIYSLLLSKSYKELATSLFSINNESVINTSKLYKSILDLVDNKLDQLDELDELDEKDKFIKWSVHLCIDYFEFVYQYYFSQFPELHTLKIMLSNIKKDYKIRSEYQAYIIKTTIGGNLDLDERQEVKELVHNKNIVELYEKNKHLYLHKYPLVCELISIIFVSVFNDMYMLFSSWKHNCPLTVYNAGNSHTTCLYYFLLQKKLFTSNYSILGWDNFNHNIQDDTHCINFSSMKVQINLDMIIFPYMLSKEQEEKRNIIQSRILALRDKLYIEMLNGKLESIDQLKTNTFLTKYCEENNLSFIEAIDKLQLKQLNLISALEYSNKVTLIK